MEMRPAIFISATSDLRAARDLVGRVLYSMGYEPRWQDIAPIDGGPMLQVLRRWVDGCQVVLQLVGHRYGAEPPAPTEKFGRCSFTQYEALYAESAGKRVLYFFLPADFPADGASGPESPELSALQSAYRQRLVEKGYLRHDRIGGLAELELSVRRIRDDLEELRREAQNQRRRLYRLAAVAVLGLVVVAGIALLVLRRQTATHRQVVEGTRGISAVQDQVAALRREVADARQEVADAVKPQPLAAGQAGPPPLPPAILEKARVLLARGNAEDQALAKIAFKQHDEADRIIQDLKAKPGNPIDDAFHLLTLEGDNWYQAGQPDRAIEPYEQAMALKPQDFTARNNVLIAHILARLGDLSAHRHRGIEVAAQTLRLVAQGSPDWAKTQNNLGTAWNNLPTGDRGENLAKAIACYQTALTVYTRDAAPAEWAMTQNNIGIAWKDLLTGDRGENLAKAIACFEAALTVRTRDAAPAESL
jgi:tetratricopeptide (TPR) repeat protein